MKLKNLYISFCRDYPEATVLLLYRGTEKLRIKNILCLPVDYFLRNLIPNQRFPA